MKSKSNKQPQKADWGFIKHGPYAGTTLADLDECRRIATATALAGDACHGILVTREDCWALRADAGLYRYAGQGTGYFCQCGCNAVMTRTIALHAGLLATLQAHFEIPDVAGDEILIITLLPSPDGRTKLSIDIVPLLPACKACGETMTIIGSHSC